MQNTISIGSISTIIGLGNPGRQYHYNRHNIGFLVLDALAEAHGGSWRTKEHMEIADIMLNGAKILLIKPQTFMNNSGKVISYLAKQGIKPENILVVHDELELSFGQLKFKVGGSHKGHNGLKSIIASCGDGFARLRFGIGRPENREDVSDYVLQNFTEDRAEVERLIGQSVEMIQQNIK
ncbi:MAG: aminoacyl-tRNA hydrolase [Candidatus Dependentiae bacterium]|nr:aminoacyl-tRNA hydrolase [Candidatus Dependentiae bacterium]